MAIASLPRLLPVLIAGSAVLLAGSARLPPAAEDAIRGISSAELRMHVEALASDEMAGRAVGHAGNDRAVQYVAESFRRAGVAPLDGAYLHPFELYHASLGADARLAIGETGKEPRATFTVGSNFYPLPESAPHAVSGPLVFAGHGISAPRQRHDDYARLDVTGAVVLVLDDVPEALRRRPGLTHDERVRLASLERKIADAKARGARGLIVIRKYLGDAQFVWPETPSPRGASYRLYSRLQDSIAVAAVAEAAVLPVRRALDAGERLIATLEPRVGVQRATAQNVLGAVEPAGPTADAVVVGAHVDHDGFDSSGAIYNGADDNASGTSAVLSMAAALTRAAAAGPRPRRRIVFALWNAEEKGSLGSEAWLDAAAGRVRVVANLNLDMVGRGEHGARSANVVHVLGYSYSPQLAALARRANEPIDLHLREEYDTDAQGLLQRSDNWPFLKRSIPALFFTTGIHADYHTPADDAERLDFAKLERITELVSRLAWLLTETDPPRFKAR